MNSENSKRIDNGRSQSRGPGRPFKRKRVSENTGRMRVSIEEASKRTLYRRANELLNKHDMAVIELAAKIGKNKSAAISGEASFSQENNSVRHTKESVLAFYLEYD